MLYYHYYNISYIIHRYGTEPYIYTHIQVREQDGRAINKIAVNFSVNYISANL